MAKNVKALEKALEKAEYCTKAKADYNFKLTNKLIDPKAVSLS